MQACASYRACHQWWWLHCGCLVICTVLATDWHHQVSRLCWLHGVVRSHSWEMIAMLDATNILYFTWCLVWHIFPSLWEFLCALQTQCDICGAFACVEFSQNFLGLVFKKYALHSLQPRSLQLDVAPIDTAFVEELVCKVALFVAEGASLHGKEFMIMQTLSVRSLVEEALEDSTFQGRAKAQPPPTQELVLQASKRVVGFLWQILVFFCPKCFGMHLLKTSVQDLPRAGLWHDDRGG